MRLPCGVREGQGGFGSGTRGLGFIAGDLPLDVGDVLRLDLLRPGIEPPMPTILSTAMPWAS